MSDHDYRILERAHADIGKALSDYKKAVTALEDARRGQPGSGFGGGGGGHTGASPVEAALGLTLGAEEDDEKDPTYPHPDLAQAKLDELTTHIGHLRHPAQRIRALIVGNTPHAATKKDQREVAAENAKQPVCEHCTKYRPRGKEEPTAVTGDVAGILSPLTMGLCRWCYDFVRDIGRLPYRADIERHNDGKKRTAKPLATTGASTAG